MVKTPKAGEASLEVRRNPTPEQNTKNVLETPNLATDCVIFQPAQDCALWTDVAHGMVASM